MNRKAAEESLMEKYDLCEEGSGCQCMEAQQVASEMVDTVIEALEGR